VPCLGDNRIAELPSNVSNSGAVQASRHGQAQWRLPSHGLLSFKATELMLQLLLLLLFLLLQLLLSLLLLLLLLLLQLLLLLLLQLLLLLLLLLLLGKWLAVMLLLVWEDTTTGKGRALCPRSHLHRL